MKRPKIEYGNDFSLDSAEHIEALEKYANWLENSFLEEGKNYRKQIAELKDKVKLMNEYVRLLPDDLYHEYIEKLNKH